MSAFESALSESAFTDKLIWLERLIALSHISASVDFETAKAILELKL